MNISSSTKSVLVILALLITMVFVCCGCDEFKRSSDATDSAQQEQALSEAQRQVGLPNITNFTMKKTLKRIEELSDDPNVINYCYLYNEYNGKLIFLGKCIGYGIPCAAQYTNPEKRMDGYALTIPQADPNGLFMPTSAEGTWVMLIGADNKPHATYIEPRIVVSPVPLT